MSVSSIAFPHLGIFLNHVGQSIRVFGVDIAFYGIIISLAMLAGILLAEHLAKKTGQDPDMYFEFALIAIVFSVIGARIYYVVFSWEYYREHPMEILNLRGGGLAIYGGVAAGVLTSFVYSHFRKVRVLQLLDTAMPALILGQIIGRWGNFFNREAFGEYTDSLLAMRLPYAAVKESDVTQQMLEHMIEVDGISCVQVHPTFLYESMWNLGVLIILLAVTHAAVRRNIPHGTVFFLYLLGYGAGRIWIEGLRTDQLLWPVTTIAVSQVLSGVMIVLAMCGLSVLYIRKSLRTAR